MRNILRELDIDFDSLEEPVNLSSEAASDYEKSVEAFSSICININEVCPREFQFFKFA